MTTKKPTDRRNLENKIAEGKNELSSMIQEWRAFDTKLAETENELITKNIENIKEQGSETDPLKRYYNKTFFYKKEGELFPSEKITPSKKPDVEMILKKMVAVVLREEQRDM